MKEQMTAYDWNLIFPNWPKPSLEGNDISTIIDTRYAGVLSAIFLDERWPGLVKPDEDIEQAIIFRVGRWCVTHISLICLGNGYEIDNERIDDADWFSHLLEKAWLYDPSDFLDALEVARQHFLPMEQPEQRQVAINNQIQTAIERHQFPFYPSRVAGHVYLASHMDEQERAAFSQFLADQGYVASQQ